MADEFLLTTANNLEGYVIVKQCGIVFGETVFKNSALDSFGAGITNMVDSFRFKATEMSGQMGLIESAREFAYEKLISQAKKRGANAVIAVESDNTIGSGNVMYISLYGTAVKVVSIEEKEEFDRIEAERKALKEEERKKAEENRKAFQERLARNRDDGQITPVEEFMLEIQDYDSMMDVWKAWKEYNLAPSFPEIDEFIVAKKDIERMYGGGDAKKYIEMLIKKIMAV